MGSWAGKVRGNKVVQQTVATRKYGEGAGLWVSAGGGRAFGV